MRNHSRSMYVMAMKGSRRCHDRYYLGPQERSVLAAELSGVCRGGGMRQPVSWAREATCKPRPNFDALHAQQNKKALPAGGRGESSQRGIGV